MELAASAGLVLDPWQCEVLDVALGEREDGKWAARQVGLIVPRQNGKGAILEALELAWLFLFEDLLIIHSAHEFATSSEHFVRLLRLIDGTADLSRLVKAVHRSHGQEGVELHDGTRIKFKTRTGGGGRGFSGDKVVLDEAMNLPDKAISALAPTMSAMPNPQLWVTASAPLITEESAALRRFCKRGRDGGKGLAYLEYKGDDDADLSDRAEWAKANPGYPERIDDDAIEAEQLLMLPDDFARERIGIWHDPSDDTNQVIPTENWIGCQDDESKLEGSPVFSLEVAEDRSWSAFGAAGRSSLGDLVHVELVDYKPGTDWVVQRAKALREKWHAKLVIANGSPASSLVKDLQKAGLKLSSPPDDRDDLVILPAPEHAKACGQFYDAVMRDPCPVRHRDQAPLAVALRGAVQQYSGDESWKWSRRRSSVDISPLVAVTLAFGQFDPVPKKKLTFAY